MLKRCLRRLAAYYNGSRFSTRTASVSLPRLHPRVTRDFRLLSSSQFRYRPKIEKIGPLEYCWTTSFGVRPDKELCGLKPLYSSLNNWIVSFASSSERNQLTFRHSSRKLPLKNSMNGLSVGFPGREKSSVTWLS